MCARVCVNTRVDDDFFEESESNLVSEKIDPLVLFSFFFRLLLGGEFFFPTYRGDRERNLHFFQEKK